MIHVLHYRIFHCLNLRTICGSAFVYVLQRDSRRELRGAHALYPYRTATVLPSPQSRSDHR